MNEQTYPSNSHKSKEASAEPQKKKVEAVVENPAVKKKKTGIQKVKDSLFANDPNSIWSYILHDILVPSLKKMFVQSVQNGVDLLVNGEITSSERRSGRIGYHSAYKKANNDIPPWRTSARRVMDYDDIVFNTRRDAEVVLDGMDAMIRRYNFVSVSDMYDLAGIANDNYTFTNYGWTNIRTADVIQVRDGYTLRLPKAMPID